MNDQEKAIWFDIFLAKVIQQEIDYSRPDRTPARIAEEAAYMAHASIEECRKAGVTNGPQ